MNASKNTHPFPHLNKNESQILIMITFNHNASRMHIHQNRCMQGEVQIKGVVTIARRERSMSALYLCVDMFCINERCLKRAAQIDSVAGQASGRLWPLTSLCYFSPLQNKLCHTSAHNITCSFPLPTPYSVSSIKSLMDVLALCHFDDSILICLCWITERRGGWRGYLTG